MTEYKRPPTMKLNTRDQFVAEMAKTGAVKSEFGSYTEHRRQIIFGGLYRIAQQRLKMEAARLAAHADAIQKIRPRLRLYRRARKALKHAQESLQKAEQIYKSPPRPKTRPPWIKIVRQAEAKIIQASHSLGLTIGYLSLHIHKNLVTKKEDQEYFDVSDLLMEAEEKLGGRKIPPECEINVLSKEYLNHVRSSLADHEFVLSADHFLEKRPQLTPAIRFRIISDVFRAAFGEVVSEQMVRSAVRRYEEQKQRHS